MREKKPYGRRTQEKERQFRKKFLFVCEGHETEVGGQGFRKSS